MHDEVLNRWQAWNDPFEGTVRTMYTDIKNLVSIGVGNLIDPIGAALGLPFVHRDGTPATKAEIATEWYRVKGGNFAKSGWTAAAMGATLRLTDEGVAALVRGKLLEMERHLAARFPEWNEWPWQAQMAALSMAWAAGPALVAPRWEAACRAWDWATYATNADGKRVLVGGAAVECHLDDTQNPGLRPRNAANKALFEEAAITHDEPAGAELGTSDTLEGEAA